ncbi:hypothetical protein ASPCADRAFT_47188 [Aspergillus carbonarius ITEM 5010]|uniref:Mitochondrial genome maintenance protein MGM101 n=1 Tax=Aspergillus carbonarius (strain ITEM 5010) TaxID=602072 RepID=A0A1R3RPM5_ASPC5|nr:hypothetical protein ASPCADRAFT_47188 [Aspergillus carbonarius ITEM 5010]
MSLPTLTRSLRIPLTKRHSSLLLRQISTPSTRYQNQSTTTTPTKPTYNNKNNTNTTTTTSSSSSSPSPPSTVTPTTSTTPQITPTLKNLHDTPPSPAQPTEDKIDWTRSFHGLSATPFPKECADILLAPTDPDEVEIKPDGILYLPEIKYRRILNRAFGPGGWGLVPRGESIVTPKMVTREYALVCVGRLVSVARGEQDYFSPDGIPTATEGCRSNALVRCCKDLGIASELWDPRWIRKYKAQYTREVFVEHVVNKRKTKIWVRKDDQVGYPWKETK